MQVHTKGSLESQRRIWCVLVICLLEELNLSALHREETFLLLSQDFFFSNPKWWLALQNFFSEQENITSANEAELVIGRTKRVTHALSWSVSLFCQ